MDFDPCESHWRKRAPELTLLETCWQMKSPSGRVLTCGVFRTVAGLEVRCGYGHDLIRSQYVSEVGAGRTLATNWKTAALQKGFAEIV